MPQESNAGFIIVLKEITSELAYKVGRRLQTAQFEDVMSVVKLQARC